MTKEIFYLYRFKPKCPYTKPSNFNDVVGTV